MSTTFRCSRRHKPAKGQRAFDFLDELKRWREIAKAEARAARKAQRAAARAIVIAERKAQAIAARREEKRKAAAERRREERIKALANQKAKPCIKCGKPSLRKVCIYCSHVADGVPRIDAFLKTHPDPYITDAVKAALATCEVSEESQRVADEWIVAATARIREKWTDDEFYDRAGKIRSLWSAPESTPQDDHHG